MTAADEAFREEVRTWLAEHLVGEFAALGTSSDFGPPEKIAVHKAWDRELAAGGWTGLTWPRAHGGRDLSIAEQIIYNEEYARAGAPHRAGFFGENLLGPTLIVFGTPEQQQRFLPAILRAEEYWCQGFSEPDAGSDLANVKTAAVLDGDEWVINGQKLWTSQGHFADWIFVLCRTEPAGTRKHEGLSFLLCPVHQPAIEMRPIVQLNRMAEFNEVFFTDARTASDLVVGQPGQGWKVVMGTLGFERGTAFLGQQLRFAAEYRRVVEFAVERGLTADPIVRQRIAGAYTGLEIMRLTGMRTLSQLIAGGSPGPSASIGKLHWSRWHQRLGELDVDLMGADALIDHRCATDPAEHRLAEFEESFLFSRAHTIYAGSSEIQRNIIGERVLGLPRDPS